MICSFISGKKLPGSLNLGLGETLEAREAEFDGSSIVVWESSVETVGAPMCLWQNTETWEQVLVVGGCMSGAYCYLSNEIFDLKKKPIDW